MAALKVDSGTGLLSPALDLAAGTVLEGAFVWGESAVSFCDGGSHTFARGVARAHCSFPRRFSVCGPL